MVVVERCLIQNLFVTGGGGCGATGDRAVAAPWDRSEGGGRGSSGMNKQWRIYICICM